MFGSRNFLFAKSGGGVAGSKLFVWGANNGNLGLNDTASRSSPVQVGALIDWAKVSVGQGSFGVKTNGTLWAWGANYYGGLGLGDTVNRSSPVQVGALTNWSTPDIGAYFGFCIKTDGTLWSCGRNNFGQLGNGNTTDTSSPVQIGSSTTWSAISAGGSNNEEKSILAVDNGKLFAWGRNYFGQLGQNDTIDRSSPVQIGALTTWKNPTSPRNMACTKTDGTLWAWGSNGYGQLGLGNTVNRSSPIQVGALTNWETPANSSLFSTCVKTDGTLWSWGWGLNGGTGQGNTNQYSSPKQVGALTNWEIPFVSGSFSAGCRKTDGTLWTWGSNSVGQLGLGDTANRSSPVQVGALTTWTLPSGSNTSVSCLQTP